MKLVEGIADVEDVDAFLDRLGSIAEEHGCTVQAFDARYVVGREHLERAVELADRAIDRGENVARERAVEVLLYAAGRRQIDRALTMGVSEGETPVVVVVAAEEENGNENGERERAAADAAAELLAPADALGEYDPECVAEFFEIEAAEREAVAGDLGDLVLERVALLDVEK